MKVVSVIPSKGRPDRLSSNTLRWLCMMNHEWFVFVEPQEYEQYLSVVPRDQLVVIGASNKGLGYVKQWIAGWLAKKDYDLVFKLDDDIRGFTKRGGGQSPEMVADNVERAIQDSIVMFKKYPDLAAVTFPYRYELWENKQWVSINARLQTSYLVRKDFFIGHPGVSTFEDFYNYLYIRSRNRMTLRYGLIGIDTNVGKTQGGLQSDVFDRASMATAEVDILRELYPALEFKPVEGKQWHIEPVLKGEFFGTKRL